VVDYLTANVLLPIGALMTAAFVGWRLPQAFLDEGFAQSSPATRRAIVWMLRLVCPAAIIAVFVAAVA
jgi:NSS family neurotransmitter:Na+ symporter